MSMEDEDSMSNASDNLSDTLSDTQTTVGPRPKGGDWSHRPPTSEEIKSLNETGQLFKSNLFKLQTQELLAEVSVKPSILKSIESALFQIKDLLDRAPDWESLKWTDSEARLSKKKMSLPLPTQFLSKEINYTLGFQKPAAVNLIGSFLLGTLAKNPHGTNIDMAVQMPKVLSKTLTH